MAMVSALRNWRRLLRVRPASTSATTLHPEARMVWRRTRSSPREADTRMRMNTPVVVGGGEGTTEQEGREKLRQGSPVRIGARIEGGSG